jgi:hypothetical protein
MGATGWSYVTPYQEDADAALQALRQQVFADGDYESPANWGLPVPASLTGFYTDEAYREFLGTIGTHSILDVFSVIPSHEPHDVGAVRRWPHAANEAAWGSERPTRADFEKAANNRIDDAPRWSGNCVVLYDGDKPAWLGFWGFSGF